MIDINAARRAATITLIASASIVPSIAFAQTTPGAGAAVGNESSLAVKLLSHDRTQTGTATLTQMPGGVQVQVVLDQPPAGPEMATIVRGSCTPSTTGKSGTSPSGTSTNDSTTAGTSTNGSLSNGSSTATATAPNGSSMSPGASGTSATDVSAPSGAASYPIGKVTAPQGGQRQTTAASTVLRGVMLSSLVTGTYALTVGTSGTLADSALCGDLKAMLPPMTPAGANKSQ